MCSRSCLHMYSSCIQLIINNTTAEGWEGTGLGWECKKIYKMQGWWRLATMLCDENGPMARLCWYGRVASCHQTHNLITRSHQQHEGNTARLATLKKLIQRYPEGKSSQKIGEKHSSHEHHLRGRGKGGRGRGKDPWRLHYYFRISVFEASFASEFVIPLYLKT